MMKRLKAWIANGALPFCLLPLLYFCLYGFDGFADTDQGFVPALAWRVKLGQLPYLDFVYVRPPLTPVLHALELWLWPLDLQVLGMRLDYYLMLWASVAFGVMTLRRHWDFQRLGIHPWMLGVLGFLFAAHNFPAMPWHTVDGIFFGSLGIWLVTHPHARWRMVAGLCALALAGLAKQPFAVMLPLGMGLLGLLHPLKKTLVVSALALGVLAAGATLALTLLPQGFAAAMLAQVMGASQAGELLRTGLILYLWPSGIAVAILLGVGAFMRTPRGKRWLAVGLLATLALFPLGHAGLAVWKMTFMPPRLGVYHALLLAAMLAAMFHGRKGGRKPAAVLLLLSVLSWASSLSWGYAVPVLFALPGVFGVLLLMRGHLGFTFATWHLPAAAGLAFLGFFLLQLFPYRDAPRWELQAGAGQVFPQLSHIRTSAENIARLKELRALDSLYQGNFIVLPAQPAAHYLARRVPPLGIDWEHDAEIGPATLHAMIARMRRLEGGILVERSRMDEAHAADPHYRSTLLKEALQWDCVPLGNYFDVCSPMR